MSDRPSRRGMLSAVAALSLTAIGTGAAFAAPVKPCAEQYEPIWWEDPNDPIFALCSAHSVAREAWEAVVHKNSALQLELPHKKRRSFIRVTEEHIVEDDDPRWIESVRTVDRTSDAMHDAAVAIARTVPTSLAGVFCLAHYYLEVAAMPGADYEGFWPDGVEDDVDPELDDEGPVNGLPMGYFVVRNILSAVRKLASLRDDIQRLQRGRIAR